MSAELDHDVCIGGAAGFHHLVSHAIRIDAHAPCRFKYSATVLLPVAMLPVRPITTESVAMRS